MKTKLLKKKDIIEFYNDPFCNVKEAGIDSDNHILNSVCLFGTKNSKNNRIYEDRAVNSLVNFSEGAKCYANHPTSEETKSRSGCRDIRDFIGVFEGARRDGDKVFANLKVREAYWNLMEDIAVLQPSGMGMSINAMVKVHQSEDGIESVADLVKLRSVDAVSDGATVSSIWESARDKATKDLDNEEENVLSAYESIVPITIENKFSQLLVEEGLIQDKMDNDKLKYEINDVTYMANDLIREVIYKKDLDLEDKKKKVMDIFDDLSKEVKKRIGKLKKEIEEAKEENMEITLAMVKENKEIMEAIRNEFKSELSVEETLSKVTTLESKIVELEKSIEEKENSIQEAKKVRGVEVKEKDEKITTLETELSEAKLKLDEIEVLERKNEKKKMIDTLVSESDLSDEDVTDLFMETLMGLKEDKEDDEVVKTIEEKVKAHIEDRVIMFKKATDKKTVVKNSGDEFVEKLEQKDSKPMSKEELKDIKENFIHNSK